MNGKKAKLLRKMAEKEHFENKQREAELMKQVPLAGCPVCNERFWMIRLDQPPPHHKFLVSMICSNKDCNQEILIDLNIEEHGKKVAPPRQEECPECGFDVYDCQCARINASNP